MLDVPVSKYHWQSLKNKLRSHMNDCGCIPSKGDADVVVCMQDVLHVYERLYNPIRPVVCMDEKPYQLLGDVKEPLPMCSSGDEQKIDSEYNRNGICSIFVFVKPLGGKHHVSVHEHRTVIEIKYLSDEMYPNTEKIILVMDNLNTHKAAFLCKAFLLAEVRRIMKRFETHYTPNRGVGLT